MRGSVCACLLPTRFVICEVLWGTWSPKNAKMHACHAHPTSSVLCEALFANWNFNFMLTLHAACLFQVNDSKSIKISDSQAISIAAIVAFIVLSVQVSFFSCVLCALWDCHSNDAGVVCWFMGLFVCLGLDYSAVFVCSHFPKTLEIWYPCDISQGLKIYFFPTCGYSVSLQWIECFLQFWFMQREDCYPLIKNIISKQVYRVF